ncbi:uncharacterized protein LOC117100633 isoform X2 [Anneissia japonica]|uniref:uncharacterized protein LOC117100633 isoform X2 n=1 Tax=Anneissia japonica TaxID=1529436 RepID=UPI0014257348|nr:uncharacterized protein LOC117100633 isoform X2 [Anneissia japonica]
MASRPKRRCQEKNPPDISVLTKGKKILAMWRNKNYYRGEVIDYVKGKVTVRYEDGEIYTLLSKFVKVDSSAKDNNGQVGGLRNDNYLDNDLRLKPNNDDKEKDDDSSSTADIDDNEKDDDSSTADIDDNKKDDESSFKPGNDDNDKDDDSCTANSDNEEDDDSSTADSDYNENDDDSSTVDNDDNEKDDYSSTADNDDNVEDDDNPDDDNIEDDDSSIADTVIIEDDQHDDGNIHREDSEVVPNSEELFCEYTSQLYPLYPNLMLNTLNDLGEVQEEVVSTSVKDTGITVMTTNNTEARRWDKVHYCMYCHIPQKKLPRHLSTLHKDEKSVIKWLNENNKEKKSAKLTKMRNLGNLLHNCEVLKDGVGELVVVYRPTRKAHASDYVPCQSCYGYFAKRELWKHKCQLPIDDAQKSKKRNRRVTEGKMLLPSTKAISSHLKTVLSGLTCDSVGQVVKCDNLILQFGEKLCSKHGHDPDQHTNIRTKMREVARLVIAFRKLTKSTNASLSSLIDPECFLDVVSAAKLVSGYDECTQTYSIPSLALKLGHSLKTCSLIQKGNALVKGDVELQNRSQNFEQLHSISGRNLYQARHYVHFMKENETIPNCFLLQMTLLY